MNQTLLTSTLFVLIVLVGNNVVDAQDTYMSFPPGVNLTNHTIVMTLPYPQSVKLDVVELACKENADCDVFDTYGVLKKFKVEDDLSVRSYLKQNACGRSEPNSTIVDGYRVCHNQTGSLYSTTCCFTPESTAQLEQICSNAGGGCHGFMIWTDKATNTTKATLLRSQSSASNKSCDSYTKLISAPQIEKEVMHEEEDDDEKCCQWHDMTRSKCRMQCVNGDDGSWCQSCCKGKDLYNCCHDELAGPDTPGCKKNNVKGGDQEKLTFAGFMLLQNQHLTKTWKTLLHKRNIAANVLELACNESTTSSCDLYSTNGNEGYLRHFHDVPGVDSYVSTVNCGASSAKPVVSNGYMACQNTNGGFGKRGCLTPISLSQLSELCGDDPNCVGFYAPNTTTASGQGCLVHYNARANTTAKFKIKA